MVCPASQPMIAGTGSGREKQYLENTFRNITFTSILSVKPIMTLTVLFVHSVVNHTKQLDNICYSAPQESM